MNADFKSQLRIHSFIHSCDQSLFHTVTIVYLFADSQEENHSVAASHSLSRSLPLL